MKSLFVFLALFLFSYPIFSNETLNPTKIESVYNNGIDVNVTDIDNTPLVTLLNHIIV